MTSGFSHRPSPWLGVAGVFGIYAAFGLAIGVMAPLVDEISTDLGLSRAAMGSILGAWALIYVFTAVPAGAVVDRLGLKRALLIGSVSITASMLLRAASTSGVSLFGAVAVFGIGGPLVSIATPKLVASLFDEDHRRLPTGVAVAAPGVGTAIGLAATNPLLPVVDDSWRVVLLLVAAFSTATTVGWLFAARAVTHVRPTTTALNLDAVPRLVRIKSLRVILGISLFAFFFSHGFSSWLPELLTDAGQSDNAAGYLAAISTAAGIVGALTITRLVPSDRRPAVLAAIFGTVGVLAVLLSALAVAPLFAALGVMGFIRAGVIPLLFLEIMNDREISLADIGTATGLFFAVGEIGGFTGPYIVGWVADTSGGFQTATMVLCGVAFGAAASALVLQRVRRTGIATAAVETNGETASLPG